MSLPYKMTSLVGGLFQTGIKPYPYNARIHTAVSMDDEVGVKIAMSRGIVMAFAGTFSKLFGSCAIISIDVRQATHNRLFMSVKYGVNEPYKDDAVPDEG